MPTTDDCMRCTKPCSQAKLAHENAKGRMYATNELLSYVKKVESGQLVEVPCHCKDCKHWMDFPNCGCTDFVKVCALAEYMIGANGYCLYGERKDGDGDGD